MKNLVALAPVLGAISRPDLTEEKKIVHHVVFFKIDIVGHTSEYEIEVCKLYVRLVQYLTLSLQWFFPRC